ncbi:MAG: hypothetical protein ACE5OQ_08585 [Woeseia sp.]
MDFELFKSNWAIVAASAIGLIIVMIVVSRLLRLSARGQLRVTLRMLSKARREEAEALRAVRKATRRAKQLHDKADRAKPRHLQEATEALEHARSLAEIANDKLLVAENHVRRVIYEEFPPVKQERLRKKYLPDREPDGRPLSF